MAIITKTVADFVSAWEGNTVQIEAALKKPGADRIVIAVRRWEPPLWVPEVWDVG